MQVFIAVMGILVTLIVVAGMILIAPAGAEVAVREPAVVPPTVAATAATPLAGDTSA